MSQKRLARSQAHQRVIAYTTRFVAGCAVLGLALVIYTALVATRQQPMLVDPDAVAPVVAVMELRPVAVRRQWEGHGTAGARHAANVPAQVRGLVIHVPPTIVAGAAVRQGDVLVRLDESDFEEEVERSKQRLADIEAQLSLIEVEWRRLTQRLEIVQDEISLVRADLDRVLEAQERGSATQREVDQFKQAVLAVQQQEVNIWEQIERIEPRRLQLHSLRASEQANMRTAMRNLERCTIRSPIEGVLQQVNVEPGEAIGTDQIVARVVNLARIEVPLRFSASVRPHVSVGDAVELHDAGASGLSWDAAITRIAPEDDERTRTMIMYVEIEQDPDDANRLSPGKFVRGVVYASRVERQVILPRRAVQGDRIRLIEDSRVRSVRVERTFSLRGEFPELGVEDAEWVAVRETLPDGGLLVLDGTRRLSEGARVDARIPGRDHERGLATTERDPNAEVIP